MQRMVWMAFVVGAAACTRVEKIDAEEPEATIMAQKLIGGLVANALCAREERCGNIGPGHTYTSAEQCVTTRATDAADDVDAEDCIDGARVPELESCLARIRGADCGLEVDPADFVACDENVMCIEPDWGPPPEPRVRGPLGGAAVL